MKPLKWVVKNPFKLIVKLYIWINRSLWRKRLTYSRKSTNSTTSSSSHKFVYSSSPSMLRKISQPAQRKKHELSKGKQILFIVVLIFLNNQDLWCFSLSFYSIFGILLLLNSIVVTTLLPLHIHFHFGFLFYFIFIILFMWCGDDIMVERYGARMF